MTLSVKICGLTSLESVNAAIKGKAQYLGCSFYEDSPRNVTPEVASEIMEFVPPNIQKVAVVSSPDDELLEEIFDIYKPALLQFDDFEDAERIEKIKKKYKCKIIKTIYVSYEDDLKEAAKYLKVADLFLFDSRHGNDLFVDLPESVFNWGLLKDKNFGRPWFLSGGLNKFNVLHAIRSSGATMINASSTLESSPGIKDVKLIEDFLKAIRVESYK